MSPASIAVRISGVQSSGLALAIAAKARARLSAAIIATQALLAAAARGVPEAASLGSVCTSSRNPTILPTSCTVVSGPGPSPERWLATIARVSASAARRRWRTVG